MGDFDDRNNVVCYYCHWVPCGGTFARAAMLSAMKKFDFKIITSRANKSITRRFAITSTSFQQDEDLIVLSKRYKKDINTNVTPSILEKTGRRLHHLKNHPLKILKDQIHDFVYSAYLRHRNGPLFTMVDSIPPVVTVEQNFDSLLVPQNHISRSRNDNYYINSGYMLRAHTSAHQVDLIRTGLDAFLVTGDVYRRDEIDRNHYPVFHQMEGVRLFTKFDLTGDSMVSHKESGQVCVCRGREGRLLDCCLGR